MAIKLTRNIRDVIVKQFLSGDTIEYLATVYSHTKERVEGVIREEFYTLREKERAAKQANGEGDAQTISR